MHMLSQTTYHIDFWNLRRCIRSVRCNASLNIKAAERNYIVSFETKRKYGNTISEKGVVLIDQNVFPCAVPVLAIRNKSVYIGVTVPILTNCRIPMQFTHAFSGAVAQRVLFTNLSRNSQLAVMLNCKFKIRLAETICRTFS